MQSYLYRQTLIAYVYHVKTLTPDNSKSLPIYELFKHIQYLSKETVIWCSLSLSSTGSPHIIPSDI